MTATIIPFPKKQPAPIGQRISHGMKRAQERRTLRSAGPIDAHEEAPQSRLEALARQVAAEIESAPPRRSRISAGLTVGQMDELSERIAQRVYTLLKPPAVEPITDERLRELAERMAEHMDSTRKR